MMNGTVQRVFFLFSRLLLGMAAIFVFGCAGSNKTQPLNESSEPAKIESVNIKSTGGDETVVEIANSTSAPFTAFKLVDPPRLVLDIRAIPIRDLPRRLQVGDGNVDEIRIMEGRSQTLTTRIELGLMNRIDYHAKEAGNVIVLSLMSKTMGLESKTPSSTEKTAKAMESPTETKLTERGETQPRVFFESTKTDIGEILGIDFFMVDHGRSRLHITTNKKIPYQMDRKSPKLLELTFENTVIKPLLQRRLDSTHFEGAVDKVTSKYRPNDKRLALTITLREMVPFHLDQTQSSVQIDFGQTVIKPPEMRIEPVRIKEQRSASISGEKRQKAVIKVADTKNSRTVVSRPETYIPGLSRTKKYTGAPMTMDFVNADVTNILRLIGEISNLNIVWGPEVKGTVSMRLKKVPWDQALDLVLANNDLGMRRQGSVIWVTTLDRLAKIEAEERRKIQEAEARLEAERKRKLAEKEQAKKLEPLLTEYFPIDFAGAGEIKEHIFLGDRGSISVDERTNTIIMQDTADNIEKAKQIVKRFDTPVKQIMIEARIVDASTNFARDLGIQWTNDTSIQRRSDTSVDFLEEDLTGEATITAGNSLKGAAFSTNSPDGWSPNVDLALGKLSTNGLTFLSLDARLAIAENENEAKVISAPKVIASNGKAASISRGDVIIIPATENVESTTLDATLSLNVTPTVSFNNYVTLQVEVTDDQAPSTSRLLKKGINTTLIVKSGDTVVIGGIYKESKGDSESGIPYLRKIPFLGWLFKAQSKNIEKSELLIFLTPRVLSFPTKKL